MSATTEPTELPLPQLLTIQGAADFLGLAEKTVRHAVEAKQIPTVEVGKRKLVSRPFLERWLIAGGRD